MKDVKIQIDESLYRYFLDRRCEAGAGYVTNVCIGFQYLLLKQGLNGLVRSYYSSQLKNPVINVDIHEQLAPEDRIWTKQIIENLSIAFLYRLDQMSEFDCVRDRGITIPTIYSFFNVVVY
jgi:hypothetical protein